jgi:hypothetical protein
MRRMMIPLKKTNNRLKKCWLESGFCLLKYWFLGWLISGFYVPWLAPGCACFLPVILFCLLIGTYLPTQCLGLGLSLARNLQVYLMNNFNAANYSEWYVLSHMLEELIPVLNGMAFVVQFGNLAVMLFAYKKPKSNLLIQSI